MPTDILIATTLAPFNIENQKRAMNTWIDAGFEIVSLNCPEEIEKLKKYFNNIKFIEIKSDAREIFDKPYIYMDSFMEFFQSENIKVCGIINSDIYFNDKGYKFKEFILKEAEESFVYSSRVDVDCLNDNGKVYDLGFDMYFFDKKISYIYPKTDFCLGQPAWDYWIIYMAIIKKIKVKKIMDSVGSHINHSINWENSNLQVCIDKLKQNDYVKGVIDTTSNEFITLFLNFINKNTERILYFKDSIKEDLKTILILYDDNISEITKKSIQIQSYRNFRLCNINHININDIDEDYIIHLESDVKVDTYYLDLLMNRIKDNDYGYCGYRVFIDNIYNINIYKYLSISNFIFNKKFYKDFYKNSKLNKLSFYMLNKFILNVFELKKENLIGFALVEIPRKKLINNLLNTIDGNIYIYGAGTHTKQIIHSNPELLRKTKGIFDSNSDLDGKRLFDINIYSSNKINNFQIDYLIISSLSFENEIYENLNEILSEEKIRKIYN